MIFIRLGKKLSNHEIFKVLQGDFGIIMFYSFDHNKNYSTFSVYQAPEVHTQILRHVIHK